MDKLIEALQFIRQFVRRPNDNWPTSCGHDILYVNDINFRKMTVEDVRKLDKFGFWPGDLNEDTYRYLDKEGNYMWNVDFDINTMTEKQWEDLRETLSDCVSSYHYGSC